MKVKKATKKQIDRYAELAALRAATNKHLDELRPSIIAHGEGVHAGVKHTLSVTSVSTMSLSTPLAKSVMTAEQIAAATVLSESIRVTVEN